MAPFPLNLLRVAFRLLYNEFAWTYDWVSTFVSMGQWRSWQRAALEWAHGGPVLEIAHGTGNLQLDMRAQGLAAVGIDLSPAMGVIAQRKLTAGGQTSPLARANVLALPFANNTFPTLIATFPAEFIVQPPVIAEFYRVLKPGGIFICVPAAQITSPLPSDRFAAWLFKVTGQAPVNEWYAPILKRYLNAGFHARLETQRLPRSVVMLILAEKPKIMA